MEAPALGPVVISRVNGGVEHLDELASDDERDEPVEQLNLHGNDLRSLDGLEAFSGLVELCLSSNYIEEIGFDALQPLTHLRVLDLSANSISSTLGFPQLSQLEELSMAHNSLQCLEGLVRPVKFPKLRYMDLRGNEIAEFNDVVSLQRLKRLSHLRLQAADGSQANPICDLDDYQHVIIKMLPKLELLDEEEVEFLKEMGSLHMPKYRSLMRRIAENRRSERQPGKSPRYVKQGLPSPEQHSVRDRGQENRQLNNQLAHRRVLASPLRVQVRVESEEHDYSQALLRSARGHEVRKEHDPAVSEKAGNALASSLPPPPPPMTSEADELTQNTQHRLVVKDCGTNTEVDFEKDILLREQVITQRETEFLEKEKMFLSKENEFFVNEKDLKNQIAGLQEELRDAQLRATKAEATVLDISNHMLQKEKDQAAATVASGESVNAIQQSQSARQDEWDAAIAAVRTSHEQEVIKLNVEKKELETKLSVLEASSDALSQKLREAEESLQQKSTALEQTKAMAGKASGELEISCKAHEAIVTQLSDEVKYHKDRFEQADKRNAQLEKQVVELKANVEAVYNKCIEKDDAVQQLKKSMATRQDEIETLRLQHVKDSERQDKLQQQQQDLYERQLQASIIQVEMEFRKEHQQATQKFQLLQRKNQERLKELKRVREAYQVSLHREANAKAEVEKLQAILADDKKKLFAEDTKRTDSFKAEIETEKKRCHTLEKQLADEQKKNARVAMLNAALEESTAESERLRGEILQFEQQLDKWKKLEDDLRAALKVKDVMLADQLRQIKELQKERQQIEEQFNDEMADFQTQIEDLEVALDENLQKCAEEEVKNEKLSATLVALERDVPEKEEQLKSVRVELDQKVSALEFIDQEMQRMRAVLENQDELFRKRLQKHLEQQREEIERIRVGAEEEREHQLREWEAERNEMMRKYEVLAIEMEDVATQNTKLRAAVDQERRRNVQNDRDMRILLAQIDRERQAKRENLRQIKSLFEQLQREAS